MTPKNHSADNHRYLLHSQRGQHASMLTEQLVHPAWLIRHVALCRLLFAGTEPGGRALERGELRAAARALPDSHGNACIAQLLRCVIALAELREREREDCRRVGRRYGESWSTLEREVEAINLRATAMACLREHGRQPLY